MAYDIASEEAGREVGQKIIFFKVSQTDYPKSYFVSSLQDMQGILESMAQNANETGEQESYTITTIEMTQAEYDALPEFKGF